MTAAAFAGAVLVSVPFVHHKDKDTTNYEGAASSLLLAKQNSPEKAPHGAPDTDGSYSTLPSWDTDGGGVPPHPPGMLQEVPDTKAPLHPAKGSPTSRGDMPERLPQGTLTRPPAHPLPVPHGDLPRHSVKDVPAPVAVPVHHAKKKALPAPAPALAKKKALPAPAPALAKKKALPAPAPALAKKKAL
ncbi:hypothetical protein ACIA8E_39550, partial [Streptomyces sp. NPDC051664]